MQLRLLQVLAQQPGNTVVLGMQPGVTTVPIHGASSAELPVRTEPPDGA